MTPPKKRKRIPNSMLGLSIDTGRLEGVVIRRSNGSLQTRHTISATLTLNPLTAEPELVGREIRNHLDQAGITDRQCLVCLPANWALSVHVEVPVMPPSEVDGFLEMEAERGLPYAPELLVKSISRAQAIGGQQLATVTAVTKDHLAQLESVLKAAKLRPRAFTLGVAVVAPMDSGATLGIMTLLLGPSGADLVVTAGGGIIALRSMDGVFEADGLPSQFSVAQLLREIKITLGQLSPAFRASVNTVRVIGRSDAVRRAESELRMRLAALGLNVDWVEGYAPRDFNKTLPADTTVSPSFSAAARSVTGMPMSLEFNPPKVRPWHRLTTRFSSKKLGWAIGLAAAIILLLSAAFLWQQHKLNGLRGQWADMEPRVRELDEMQVQIRRYRPWFDTSLGNLSLLRRITEAFPEDGAVSAKTLEIRDLGSITCSGTARDNQALLQMLERLRESKEVSRLKVDSIRGKAPLQFTFNFHWGEGGNDASQ